MRFGDRRHFSLAKKSSFSSPYVTIGAPGVVVSCGKSFRQQSAPAVSSLPTGIRLRRIRPSTGEDDFVSLVETERGYAADPSDFAAMDHKLCRAPRRLWCWNYTRKLGDNYMGSGTIPSSGREGGGGHGRRFAVVQGRGPGPAEGVSRWGCNGGGCDWAACPRRKTLALRAKAAQFGFGCLARFAYWFASSDTPCSGRRPARWSATTNRRRNRQISVLQPIQNAAVCHGRRLRSRELTPFFGFPSCSLGAPLGVRRFTPFRAGMRE